MMINSIQFVEGQQAVGMAGPARPDASPDDVGEGFVQLLAEARNRAMSGRKAAQASARVAAAVDQADVFVVGPQEHEGEGEGDGAADGAELWRAAGMAQSPALLAAQAPLVTAAGDGLEAGAEPRAEAPTPAAAGCVDGTDRQGPLAAAGATATEPQAAATQLGAAHDGQAPVAVAPGTAVDQYVPSSAGARALAGARGLPGQAVAAKMGELPGRLNEADAPVLQAGPRVEGTAAQVHTAPALRPGKMPGMEASAAYSPQAEAATGAGSHEPSTPGLTVAGAAVPRQAPSDAATQVAETRPSTPEPIPVRPGGTEHAVPAQPGQQQQQGTEHVPPLADDVQVTLQAMPTAAKATASVDSAPPQSRKADAAGTGVRNAPTLQATEQAAQVGGIERVDAVASTRQATGASRLANQQRSTSESAEARLVPLFGTGRPRVTANVVMNKAVVSWTRRAQLELEHGQDIPEGAHEVGRAASNGAEQQVGTAVAQSTVVSENADMPQQAATGSRQAEPEPVQAQALPNQAQQAQPAARLHGPLGAGIAQALPGEPAEAEPYTPDYAWSSVERNTGGESEHAATATVGNVADGDDPTATQGRPGPGQGANASQSPELQLKQEHVRLQPVQTPMARRAQRLTLVDEARSHGRPQGESLSQSQARGIVHSDRQGSDQGNRQSADQSTAPSTHQNISQGDGYARLTQATAASSRLTDGSERSVTPDAGIQRRQAAITPQQAKAQPAREQLPRPQAPSPAEARLLSQLPLPSRSESRAATKPPYASLLGEERAERQSSIGSSGRQGDIGEVNGQADDPNGGESQPIRATSFIRAEAGAGRGESQSDFDDDARGQAEHPSTGLAQPRPATVQPEASAPTRTAVGQTAASNDNPSTAAAGRAELVEQVRQAVARAAESGTGGGVVRVKLHPENLGALEIRVKVAGRQCQAQISADKAEVGRFIEANSAELLVSLSEQGLELVRFAVNSPGSQAERALGSQAQAPLGDHVGDHARAGVDWASAGGQGQGYGQGQGGGSSGGAGYGRERQWARDYPVAQRPQVQRQQSASVYRHTARGIDYLA